MKRALCFLLCVALLCTAVPMTAVAEFGGISLSGQLTEGNSVDVMWHPYTGEGFDHYEYSVKDLTNGGDAAIFRVHTNQEKFSIPANMMIVNHNLRVWVGACDVNSDVLAQAQTEFLVQAAQEELVISLTDVKPGDHVYVSWNKISGAKHYDYTVRNTTTDTVIIDRTSTRADQITISGDLILSENHYKVWVGAVDENGDVICDSIQYFDVPKCSHRNPQRVNKQHNWQQNDDETHHVTEYYDKKCVDCGELIEEGLVDEYDEPHQLDENGDCTLCDYRFSCPHTEKEYRLKSETYTPDGEEEHIHDVQYSEYCANAICGKLLRDQADEKRIHEREMHTFDKGVCILCGYRRAAQLSASVARGMSEAQVGDLLSATVTFKGGDGNYRYCWEIYCNGTLVRERTPFDAQHSMSIQAECAGEYVFRVIVMDGEGSEATADSKPITVKEAACLHTETEDVESDLYYESISDSHHNKITEYSRVCKACGERVSTWDSPVSEEHHFVDGVCQECKLPEPGECAHSEKKSEELRRTKRSISDTQHVIEVYYRDVCAKCGVELVAERMENAGEEAHALVDGRCECGYVDTTGACDHADREETPGAPVCVSISDTQHKTTVAYKVVCKTCGAELEGREESLVADHTFDAQGLCAECGYQKLVETVSGSFGSTTYTMTTGTPLTVTVSAQCTGGELAKVTINGVTTSMVSPSSMDIAGGTEWSGNLTIDGTQSPFDVPGIYEVQLWVKTASGFAQSVARTTITVVEPEVELSMTVQGSVDEAGNVNFNWNGIESADHYGINFRINDVPEYGDIHMIGKETSYQIPASRFQGEETVKFWVAAYDAGNNMIPVSSTSTNKVQADTTITVPARAETVSGSFGSATYTMTTGAPLTVTVSAQCTGGELAKVTINGVTASMVSPSSIDIAGGTEWSGNLTIDGTQSPFDVPGTYEVQLWVKTATGLAQSVARTTITVVEPEIELFMTIQGSVDEAGNVNFNWNGIESADHYGINFRINDVSEYGDVLMIGRETSYQIPASRFQGGETVKFWVGAYLADGNMVSVSNHTTDKVQNTAEVTVPVSKKLGISLNYSFDTSGVLNLSWNSVEGAASYGINYCINDVDAFDAIQNVGNTISYQIPASQLSGGMVVKFWVGAYLADGSMVPVSNYTTDKVQNTVEVTVPALDSELSVKIELGQTTATVGDTVKATAVVSGGSGEYDYGWTISLNGTVIHQTDMSMDSCYTWTPEGAGSYVFAVTVKDSEKNSQTVSSGVITVSDHVWKTETSVSYANPTDEGHDVVTVSYQVCTICGAKTEATTTTVTAQHNQNYRDFWSNHPHQLYSHCKDCDHKSPVNHYDTANGKVQSADKCCICHGHAWPTDEPEEVNGEWFIHCGKCGKTQKVDAPKTTEKDSTDNSSTDEEVNDTVEWDITEEFDNVKDAVDGIDDYSKFIRGEESEVGRGAVLESLHQLTDSSLADIYFTATGEILDVAGLDDTRALYITDRLIEKYTEDSMFTQCTISLKQFKDMLKYIGYSEKAIDELVLWFAEKPYIKDLIYQIGDAPANFIDTTDNLGELLISDKDIYMYYDPDTFEEIIRQGLDEKGINVPNNFKMIKNVGKGIKISKIITDIISDSIKYMSFDADMRDAYSKALSSSDDNVCNTVGDLLDAMSTTEGCIVLSLLNNGVEVGADELYSLVSDSVLDALKKVRPEFYYAIKTGLAVNENVLGINDTYSAAYRAQWAMDAAEAYGETMEDMISGLDPEEDFAEICALCVVYSELVEMSYDGYANFIKTENSNIASKVLNWFGSNDGKKAVEVLRMYSRDQQFEILRTLRDLYQACNENGSRVKLPSWFKTVYSQLFPGVSSSDIDLMLN